GTPQMLEAGAPAEMRHHAGGQDQVGLGRAGQCEDLPGIRGALDLPVASLRQHALEEPDVRGLIVDAEDSGLNPVRLSHRYLTALARSSSSTPRNCVTDSGFVR